MERHVDKTLRQQWLTDFVKKQHLSQNCKGTVSYTSSHALHMHATCTIWIIISEKHLSYFRILIQTNSLLLGHWEKSINIWQSRNLQSFLSFHCLFLFLSLSLNFSYFLNVCSSLCVFISLLLYLFCILPT